MRLLIAGASGRTGCLLTQLAIVHGHDVTALVRDASRISQMGDRMRILVGDVLEPSTLKAAIEGQDAVVSVLAPRPRTSGRVYVEGTRNLADAAEGAGVLRIVVVSAEGAGVDPKELATGYRLVLRIPVVARLYPDIARMEAELRARVNLDWTVVRPAILTNGRPRGRYRTAVGAVVRGGLRISRADLAEFLLDAVEKRSHVHESVAVAY
ncbi:MAG: NAD(P)H-binding protein [Coriobacteriia bacterium]|nr:NAD(P)H-binding protein [Coriobacteriia bacterium]